MLNRVYILLEKDLKTEVVRVESVYATRELAEKIRKILMDKNEEKRAYKIVRKAVY
jgi:hypothetical protein